MFFSNQQLDEWMRIQKILDSGKKVCTIWFHFDNNFNEIKTFLQF